jgi:hypothetical protein
MRELVELKSEREGEGSIGSEVVKTMICKVGESQRQTKHECGDDSPAYISGLY